MEVNDANERMEKNCTPEIVRSREISLVQMCIETAINNKIKERANEQKEKKDIEKYVVHVVRKRQTIFCEIAFINNNRSSHTIDSCSMFINSPC